MCGGMDRVIAEATSLAGPWQPHSPLRPRQDTKQQMTRVFTAVVQIRSKTKALKAQQTSIRIVLSSKHRPNNAAKAPRVSSKTKPLICNPYHYHLLTTLHQQTPHHSHRHTSPHPHPPRQHTSSPTPSVPAESSPQAYDSCCSSSGR